MQISEQVIEVLNYLCEKIGITVDWTSANILPYLSVLCEKYIHYEIATSAVWLLVGIIGINVFLVFIRKVIRKAVAKLEEDFCSEFWAMFLAICVIALIISIWTSLHQIFDIIECCTIPEKVILEYIQSLLEKTGA